MSAAVGNVSMYVLVNIVEIEECNPSASNTNNFSLFNTNIVFNRYGCLISKYRKINLFIEPFMTVPEAAELATFDTDFGVTFGHFICFDILFKSPAYDMVLSNISHILYPSMWFSEIPFLSSIQLQQNFAHRNNIALLSSGANSPSYGKTGSGVFIGKHGAVDSIISWKNETKIIVAKVPKNLNDDSFNPDSPTIQPYTAAEMDKLKTMSFKPKGIHPLKETFYISDGNTECEFNINYTKISLNSDESIGYTYKFAAFNGIRSYQNIINAGEIYCSIVPCLSNDDNTCGQKFKNSEKLVPSVLFHSIKITVKVREPSSDDYLIMPNTLDFSLHPLSVDKFVFSEDDESNENFQIFEMRSQNELDNILTFGIYGRNFSADNKNFNIEEDTTGESTTPDVVEIATEDTENDSQNKNKNNFNEEDKYTAIKLAIYAGLMIVLCIIAAILVHRRLQDPYQHPLIVMRRKSEMHVS